jgi:GNAT superfamily N-acetyltransferase
MYSDAFPAGCFVIENETGLIGYSFSRLWGEVAWIGPVSIIPAQQAKKLGQKLMVQVIETLKHAGARVIGLETVPRSLRNIGFYAKLGFLPQNLTLDLVLPVPRHPEAPWPTNYEVVFYGDANPAERMALGSAAEELGRRLDPHLSIRPEIELTRQSQYGDTICVRHGRELLACFVVHTKTYSEDETPHYLKIVMTLMDSKLSIGEILSPLFAFAHRQGLVAISFRTPARYHRAYAELIAAGFQVFHGDLRLTLEGYEEVANPKGFYLSKWE